MGGSGTTPPPSAHAQMRGGGDEERREGGEVGRGGDERSVHTHKGVGADTDTHTSNDEPHPHHMATTSASAVQNALSGMNTSANDTDAHTSGEKESSLMNLVWITMDDPRSSLAAKLISIVVMSAIVISIASLVLETLESLESWPWWPFIELVCVAIFTLEYILRLLSSPNKRKFFFAILNLVDLAAILPFYISLGLNPNFLDHETTSGGANLSFVRVIRMVRIFRIFKLGKYAHGLNLFVETLAMSSPGLGVLGFMLLIYMILFSSIMFFAEKDENREMFQSIPHTFWWCLTTMTTVGYGDVYPRSWMGKLIGSVTMASGLVIIALPVTVIAFNFSTVYSNWRLQNARSNDPTSLEALQQRLEEVRVELENGWNVRTSLHADAHSVFCHLAVIFTNIDRDDGDGHGELTHAGLGGAC